jgi:hypothetical protein
MEPLTRHMKTKHPQPCAIFAGLNPLGSELLKTGKVGDDVDFDANSFEMQQTEAAQDTNFLWSSRLNSPMD